MPHLALVVPRHLVPEIWWHLETPTIPGGGARPCWRGALVVRRVAVEEEADDVAEARPTGGDEVDGVNLSSWG